MERTGDAREAWQGTDGNATAIAAGGAGGAGGGTERDTAAFTDGFSRLAPRLYDFLARLSGRTEAADALLRQAASQAAMGASSAAQWSSEQAWFFSRAFAVLPSNTPAETGDLAAFANPDRTQLPPGGDGEAIEAMARAAWRAVSALPHDQHALLHLRVREAMTFGEAASVLGITEREANDRSGGLTAAVEETSRALFLLRYGRAHDATLNDLLTGRDANRLTPELRAFLRDYVRDTPTLRAMLAPVPPLAVYAAFAPLPLPPALVATAAEAALPWLATGRAAASPAPAEAATAMLPEQEATIPFDPNTTGMLPEAAPSAATALMGAAPPPPGGYERPYGQPPTARLASPSSPSPAGGANAGSGTQTLNIPVRQRIISERTTVVRPSPPPRRGISPLAIVGGLAGALVVVVGALTVFLSGGFGGGTANARATATIGGTPALGGSPTTTIPDVLLTSTAIAANRLLTVTAQAGTPTPIPTQPPQPVIRPPAAPEPNSSAAVPTTPLTPAGTVEPRVTLAPTFAPATPVAPEPRITLAPPVPPRDTVDLATTAPTRAATAVAPPARPSTATAVTTSSTVAAPPAATATRPVVSTAAPPVAPTAAATRAATTAATTAAPAAPAATTMPAATPTAMPAAATPAAMRTAAAATPAATTAMSGGVTASTTFLIVNTNPSGAVTLTNKGGATNFTASASGRGVSVSPASGTIGANGSANLTVTINRAGLSMGNYPGNIVVTTDSGTVTILVSYAVP